MCSSDLPAGKARLCPWDDPRNELIELAALLDARGLAAQLTKIVELGAAHLAQALDLDLLDGGAVQGEDPLDADAVRDLADGKGLAQVSMLLSDHDPLKNLDAFADALLDLHMDAKGIAGAKLRYPLQFA